MKYDKKHKVMEYCDDDCFNKSIKPLFFEFAQPTVYKNGPTNHGGRVSRGKYAFYKHKNPTAETTIGKGRLICPG